ncbi:MAG: hypothetical protein JSS77_10395 [Acidobacteria bacterium]|nr:hypothetical protein [Acidobacteriota bacterium]
MMPLIARQAFNLSIIFLTVCAAGCDRSAKVPGHETLPSASQDSPVFQRADGVWVNENGWTLPVLETREIRRRSTERLNDSFGNSVEVDVADYVPDDLVIDEPFDLIGRKYGKVRILSVRRFARSEKAFAYQFSAQKAAFDSETNRFEGSGLIFIYFLVDEDGDGKFEAFLGDQRLPLIVPRWTHP